MSQPGWYPDPAGTPNQFRYWDGRTWSAATTADPRTPPPGAGTPTTRRDRRRLGPAILVAALLLAVVIAGVFVVGRLLTRDRDIADPAPLPSSSVTGGDDRSPTPEPPFPTASPTPTPPPEPEPSQPTPTSAVQPCPEGDPTARAPHPSDDRVHGGNLSFPRLPEDEWPEGGGLNRLSWAYDVAGQAQATEPGWQAMFAVGALGTMDGFEAPKQAAQLVMDCMATSNFYSDFSGRSDVWSKAVTVDGHQGWSLRAEIRVDDVGVEAEGDVLEVIVLDADEPEGLGMFVGGVPIDDDQRIATLDRVIAGLRVG